MRMDSHFTHSHIVLHLRLIENNLRIFFSILSDRTHALEIYKTKRISSQIEFATCTRSNNTLINNNYFIFSFQFSQVSEAHIHQTYVAVDFILHHPDALQTERVQTVLKMTKGNEKSWAKKKKNPYFLSFDNTYSIYFGFAHRTSNAQIQKVHFATVTIANSDIEHGFWCCCCLVASYLFIEYLSTSSYIVCLNFCHFRRSEVQ